MAIATERVARKYLDVVASVAIPVDFPVFEVEDVKVYYGRESNVAVYNVDYTLALDPPNFNTFTITPLASLVAKIDALIAADPTETNFIVVRRVMDFLTVTNEGAVRDLPFLSRELDRTAMRFAQQGEQLQRAIKLSPKNVDQDPQIEELIEDTTLLYKNGKIVAGPTGQDVADAQANAVIALTKAAEAAASALAADADATQTAADRVQTGLDRVQTTADAVATAADRVQTGLDRTQTGADATQTAADRVQTGLDRTQTGLDKAATAADRVQTGLDRAATGQDAADAALYAGQVQGNIIPVGAIAFFADDTPPSGWLVCDGSAVTALYPELRAYLVAAGQPFGDNGTDPKLPDLRGEFIRGWDGGRGIDAGRVFGSAQADELEAHVHTIYNGSTSNSGVNNGGVIGATTKSGVNFNTTESTGGTETRPRNIALLPCIKAFGQVDVTGAANLAELLAAIATQAEAEAGTDNTKLMTPLRSRQHLLASEQGRLLATWDHAVTGNVSAIVMPAFDGMESLLFDGSYVAGGRLLIQFSTDGGATWLATGYSSYAADGVSSDTGSNGIITSRNVDGWLDGAILGLRANEMPGYLGLWWATANRTGMAGGRYGSVITPNLARFVPAAGSITAGRIRFYAGRRSS